MRRLKDKLMTKREQLEACQRDLEKAMLLTQNALRTLLEAQEENRRLKLINWELREQLKELKRNEFE